MKLRNSETNKNYFFVKKAFSTIELLVVVGIMVVMTGAVFVNRNNEKAASNVEAVSRQVASQLRTLQNEALNGKQISGKNICYYKFNASGSSYTVSYMEDCAGASAALGSQTTDLSKKKVSFPSSMSLSFKSPRGNIDYLNSVNTIELKSGNASSWVCVSYGGVVSESKVVCGDWFALDEPAPILPGGEGYVWKCRDPAYDSTDRNACNFDCQADFGEDCV